LIQTESINNKRDDFNRSDLIKIGESISLKRPDSIIDEVISAVNNWPRYAKDAGVNKKTFRKSPVIIAPVFFGLW